MRLILLAAVLVASMAVGAEGRTVTAVAPLIDQDRLVSTFFVEADDNFPSFPRRTFTIDFHVDWNGVRQEPFTLSADALVLYEAMLDRRSLRSLNTIPIGFGIDGPSSETYATYDDIEAYIAVGPGDSGILPFGSTSIVVLSSFSQSNGVHRTEVPRYSFFDVLGTWEDPVTAQGVARRPRSRNGLDDWRSQWSLRSIEGPWHESDVILFDEEFAGNHFTVTLDRFGWQPVDELIVGAPRRGAIRRSRDVLAGANGMLGAAAIPEPTTMSLAAVVVAITLAWRAIHFWGRA